VLVLRVFEDPRHVAMLCSLFTIRVAESLGLSLGEQEGTAVRLTM
jgi:hypothetical protein